MNQFLNDEIRDHLKTRIPNNKNFQKANDIINKATTASNFFKIKNKNDIMEKITNILNDKKNKENFDSCYLLGTTNLHKNSNNNNNFKNNKNDFLKTARITDTKMFNNKKVTNEFLSKNNFDDMDKKEISKKNPIVKVFSPKNNDLIKKINHFDNLYRDSYLNRIPLHFSNDNNKNKLENKIFNERVNKEINSNKNIKNNFMIFYEQINNSKNKIKCYEKETIEAKRESNKEILKEEEDGKKNFLKSRDPESTNLFLTKFTMKAKNNSEKFSIDNNNLYSKNFRVKDFYNTKDNKKNYNEKEIELENQKNEIENNVSKSIEIENNYDEYSYYSLKNEFSFLLEKGQNENFILRDIINDVKLAQNKISSECDDIKNLIRFANDTKSKLQMHKTENKFFNIKNKLNNEKIINNYYNNINKKKDIKILKKANDFMYDNKLIIEDKNKNFNICQIINDEENQNILNNKIYLKSINQNSISVDNCLHIGENMIGNINEKKAIYNLVNIKKLNKKRSHTEINFKKYLKLSENFDKNMLPNFLNKKNLSTKNKSTFNKDEINEDDSLTNNYYVIKSNLNNKKNEKDSNFDKNNDLIFDPSDIELHKRQLSKNKDRQFNDIEYKNINEQNYNHKNKLIENQKNVINYLNNYEFNFDNNKNIFDRDIKSILNPQNKKYYGIDGKMNIQKFQTNQNNNNFSIKKTKDEKVNFKNIFEDELKKENAKKNTISIDNNTNNKIISSTKNKHNENIKHFNEMNKNIKKRNFIWDSIDDQQKTEETVDNNKNNQKNLIQENEKKFYVSSNNFHKNKILNYDSIDENKNNKKIIYPQTLIFKDVNNNPFLKTTKNFMDKNNFLDNIKKIGSVSLNKDSNKISFEKKKMSKTNYNFAEFLKNNPSDKKSSNLYNKKNFLSKEKLIISAETNFISNNLLNDHRIKNDKNYFY